MEAHTKNKGNSLMITLPWLPAVIINAAIIKDIRIDSIEPELVILFNSIYK
mgnify:CR=1 FL=1